MAAAVASSYLPEPSHRLKALSSIEGLGSRAGSGIYAGESKG